jgi:hypothetical protein
MGCTGAGTLLMASKIYDELFPKPELDAELDPV